MLAKVFTPTLYRRGMLIQPKLNGVRMLACNGVLVSRDGERWSDACLHHIREALAEWPRDLVLDGELYYHGLSLQEINSRVAVKRVAPHADEARIIYHVFDYVSRAPCISRLAWLDKQRKQTWGTAIAVVPSFLTSSLQDSNRHYERFKRDGYEGGMYRAPDKGYAVPGEHGRKDNRVSWLLKRKDWLDLDATIVGMVEGDGKHSGMLGAFVLDYNGTQFRAGSGPTDIERQEYWALGRRLAGCRCKVQYEMLSDTGVPLKPVIIQVELP